MSSADKFKAPHRETDGHRRVDFRKDFEPLSPADEKQEVLHGMDARDAAVIGIHDLTKRKLERAREQADDADLEIIEETAKEADQYLADYHAALQEIAIDLNTHELEGRTVLTKPEWLRLTSLPNEAKRQADELQLERRKSAKKTAFLAREQQLDDEERAHVAKQDPNTNKIRKALFTESLSEIQQRDQQPANELQVAFRQKQIDKSNRRSKEVAERKKLTDKEFHAQRVARLDKALNPPKNIGNNSEEVGIPTKDHKPKILTSNEERTQLDIERYNATELSSSATIEAGFSNTLSKIDTEWDKALTNKGDKPKPVADFSKESDKERKKLVAELAALGLDPKTIDFAESLFTDMLDTHSTSDKMAQKMVRLAARGVDSNKLDALSAFIEKHTPALAPTPEQINDAVEKIGMKELVKEQAKAEELRTKHAERKTANDDNLQAAVARRNDRLSRYEAELVGQAQADHPRDVARTNAVDVAIKKEWTRLFDLAELAYVNAAGQALDTKRGDARSLGLTASAEVFAAAGKSLAEVQSMAENFKKNAFMDKYMPTKQAYGAAEKSLNNQTDLLLEKTKPTIVQSLKNSWRKLWS